MDPKKIAQDTVKVLQSYLTYQAVRTIIHQLSETNPPQAIWLSQYSSQQKIQDGEAYIESLMLEHKELVVRILTVREYIAQEIVDFLPQMLLNSITESNMKHRRHLLERLTQSPSSVSEPEELE